MKMSGLLYLLFVSIISLSPRWAQAQLPLYDEASRNQQKSQWQVDLQTTYYQATANYTNSGGQFESLPAGNEYKLIDFDFGARWIASPKWAFYTSSRVSNAESSDGFFSRRNSTFTQVVLGGDYKLYSSKKYEISPDFSVTLPLERVDVTQDEVLNREGAIEVTGKVVGRAQLGKWDPFAFLGINYRDEGRSTLLPYGAGVDYHWQPSMTIGAEIRGYQTIVDDEFSDDRIRREAAAARNGAALRYFSVNPSLLESNFWLRGNLFQNWGFKVGAGTSITGASTSAGWNLIGGVNYSFESLGRSTQRPFRAVEDTPNFQEETDDGVDQNLFQIAPPPTPPPPPAPVQQPDPEAAKKRIQKELDQTEFQIELKSTKPKKKRK